MCAYSSEVRNEVGIAAACACPPPPAYWQSRGLYSLEYTPFSVYYALYYSLYFALYYCVYTVFTLYI
jgi:hypothetical protein